MGEQRSTVPTRRTIQVLTAEAGVGVDVACFDALADVGDRQIREGDVAAAAHSYGCAVDLYRGDLYDDTDVQTVI